MDDISTIINKYLGGPLGLVLGAVVIFIVGLIVAKILSGLVKKLLAKTGINNRMNSSTGKSLDIESIGSKVTFWFVLILATSGALNMLNISAISDPLAKMISQVLSFLPILMGAAVIGVIGWVVATIARTATSKLLSNTNLDNKIGEDAGIEPISNTLANVVYWIILLIVFTEVLGRLGMDGLFKPLTNMLDKVFYVIPDILSAAVIFFIGLVVAKIVRGIVKNLVASLNLQKYSTQAGISNDNSGSLPNLAGSLVFLLIIIPVSIAALDRLKVEVISRPATNMLNNILEMLPSVTTAIFVLVVTYFVMRMVTNVIKSILENTQLNTLPEKIGMQEILGETKVSDLIASLILLFAMLFAVIMSANIVGFTQISDIVTMFIGFGGDILLGSIILLIGFWLANLVSNIVARSEQGSKFLANLVRVLIMGLVLAMGLKAMGIADSIVNLAFGLTLGSVAVAFALSFGLGGQEAAARFLRKAQDKCDAEELDKKDTQKPEEASSDAE